MHEKKSSKRCLPGKTGLATHGFPSVRREGRGESIHYSSPAAYFSDTGNAPGSEGKGESIHYSSPAAYFSDTGNAPGSEGRGESIHYSSLAAYFSNTGPPKT